MIGDRRPAAAGAADDGPAAVGDHHDPDLAAKGFSGDGGHVRGCRHQRLGAILHELANGVDDFELVGKELGGGDVAAGGR